MCSVNKTMCMVTPRDGEPEVFDRVCSPRTPTSRWPCSPILPRRSREILGAIPYQANEIVLHTDTRLLPRTRRAWASWNYHSRAPIRPPVTLTYNLNRLQGHRSAEPILETLNPAIAIDPAKVLDRMTYHHPVYSVRAIEAQRRYGEINGQREPTTAAPTGDTASTRTASAAPWPWQTVSGRSWNHA